MKGNVYFMSPIFLRGQGWTAKKEVEPQKEAEIGYETHFSHSFSYEFSTHTPPAEFIPSLKTHSQNATPAPHLLAFRFQDFPLEPGHSYFLDVPENMNLSMFGELPKPATYRIERRLDKYAENVIALPLNTSLTDSVKLCEELVNSGVHASRKDIFYWDSEAQDFLSVYKESCQNIIGGNLILPVKRGAVLVAYAPKKDTPVNWNQK